MGSREQRSHVASAGAASPPQRISCFSLFCTSEQFVPLLTRIDECIAFLQKHARYKDAHVYMTRFQQLQSKALGLVRAHITNTLKTATQNVMTQTQVGLVARCWCWVFCFYLHSLQTHVSV